MYHPQGTVVIGRFANTNTYVGFNFIVYNINNFYVANLSIALTNVKYIFFSHLVDY